MDCPSVIINLILIYLLLIITKLLWTGVMRVQQVVRKRIIPSKIVQLLRLTKLGDKLSNWNKRVQMETKAKISCQENELNKAIASVD